MADMITIKPAPGVKVKNPATGENLPDEGVEVVRSSYWVRALGFGDVVEVPTASAKAGKEK